MIFYFSGRVLNKYELNYRLIYFTDSFPIYSNFIHRQNFESFFLEPYEEKTSYTVLGGGFFFIYIYPDEPSIESLQLMFGPEEKEEIFGKWVFMIRSRIKLI